MADDDDAPTRDGAPSVTGYRVSPSITQAPREARYRRGEERARGLGRITRHTQLVMKEAKAAILAQLDKLWGTPTIEQETRVYGSDPKLSVRFDPPSIAAWSTK